MVLLCWQEACHKLSIIMVMVQIIYHKNYTMTHWNKIEILYNGKLQETWRIEPNFVYSLGNSALSSTFPKVFRCTKFQFCSSDYSKVAGDFTVLLCDIHDYNVVINNRHT